MAEAMYSKTGSRPAECVINSPKTLCSIVCEQKRPMCLSFQKSVSSCVPFSHLRSSCHSVQMHLQVKAVVGYPPSMAWWKRGNQPNMREINSAQGFVDAITKAGEKLVLVDFYSVGCRSCKVLHPKICQIAAENPDIEVFKVNFHDNIALCKSLNVNILPFFHFYRGQEGRVDAFSCSLTKPD